LINCCPLRLSRPLRPLGPLRWLPLWCGLALWLACTATFAKERRVALLLGNSAYASGRLAYPVQDVEVIRGALLKLGFGSDDVVVRVDADRRTMARAIQEFGVLARGADVAFVYYSGHGAQALGQNWLIPVDAEIRSEGGYEIEALPAQGLLSQLQASQAKVSVLVLDACRDNPVALNKSGTKGLGRMDLSEGTLIAFATAPNTTAVDNGLYAQVLAAELLRPGQELLDVFRNTAAEIERRTKRRQLPRVGEMALSQRVYLAGRVEAAQPSATPVARNSILDDENYETADDGVALLREALARRSLAAIRAAAEQNDAQATYLLGVAHLVGLEVPLDLATARRHLQRAAQMQFRRAVYAYAGMLYDGEGGPADKLAAVGLWEAGAVQRFSPSMMRLARYYAFEAPPAERRPDRARDLYTKASVDTPDALAALALMTLGGVGQRADAAAALRQLEEAAAKGSGTANLRLARFHRWGQHVKRDIERSLAYYAKAVELRSLDALTEAGRMHLEGGEAPRDLDKGFDLLKRAAARYSRLAESLLVKAYLDEPKRMPAGWPLADKAVAAARAGQIDGLVRLVLAHREGHPLASKDWVASDRLAKLGLEIMAAAAPDSEAAWPVYGHSLGRARILAAEEGRVPVEAAVLSALKAAWGATKTLKRFTVVVQCAGQKQDFHVYVWDATGAVAPTEAQFEWIRKARGCEVPPAVVDGFQKLYKIARENNVSFAELSAYALSQADKPGTAAAAPASAPGAAAARGGPRTIDSAGLAELVQDIGRYERVKVKILARVQAGPADEEALDRFLAQMDLSASDPEKVEDRCAGVRLLGRERSKKAGEAAEVIRLDLLCGGQANALLLLPDDPAREATLFVNTRKAAAGAGTAYGTRYVFQGGKVLKSWHDIDGDGKPDSFGFHLTGGAQPTRTLALTTSAM
jgi:hypothetical protein